MKKTKLILCTYSGLYASIVLHALLEAEKIEVVGIVNSTRVLKKSYGFVRGAIEMLRLTGWRYVFFQLWLTEFFHLCQPFSRRKSIRRLARKHAIPVYNTSDINSAQAIQFIRERNPDLLLSAYFNQLIQAPMMSLPEYGCINIHPSLLPKLRGADPVFHALYRNSEQVGVTVHYLNYEFDTGNILRQEVFPVLPGGSVLVHYAMLFEAGARLAIDALDQIQTRWSGIPQPQGGDYVSWPTRQAMADFRRQGHVLMSLNEYFALLKGQQTDNHGLTELVHPRNKL